ncbi:PilZ domain-containing protein [Myxococcota bacterium]|jgi:hypothetical protein|nr:PilZ domain-containing protein [Myxococcota bacterium]
MTTTELLRNLPFVRVAEPVRFPPGTGAGQRTSPRRLLRADARVRDAAGEDGPLPLEVDEVSATGAFVLSDLLLPVGATVEIAFNLPLCDDDVVATGRVVRVEERGGRPGMGIHFDRMAGGARASLRAYTTWQ